MSTLRDLFESRVKAHPDSPLLINAETGEAWSYAHSHQQALRWATFYRAQGLGPGDRIAVVLPNSPDFAAMYLGAALAGITVCPYNPALTEPELEGLIAQFGSKLALVTPALSKALSCAVPVHAVGAKADLPQALPEPAEELPPVSPDTLMVLIMTSGTTGGVKACQLSHANLVWTAEQTAIAFERDAESRYLTPLPLFHINAQVIGVWGAIYGSGAVAVGARLPAAKLWEAAERSQATGMSLVPAMVYDLLELPGDPPPSLKYTVCSSAPLPTKIHQRFEERFGIPLLFCYGLSEAGCFVSYSRREPKSPAGSVGRPLGCEVRIVGGEVTVSGKGIFRGYDGDPEATARALRDAWLHTGDEGTLDELGFLYLRGRLKDMINRGGEKIAPDAIEAVLRDCPDLAEVAVFAVPDERLGEEVAAAVVLRPGSEATDEDLWDYCLDKLAEFETPKHWLKMESLPRGGTGKILRRALKEHWHAAR